MRPDGPREPVAGPDSGPEPPFPIKLSGPVIKGFGRGSKEVKQKPFFPVFLVCRNRVLPLDCPLHVKHPSPFHRTVYISTAYVGFNKHPEGSKFAKVGSLASIASTAAAQESFLPCHNSTRTLPYLALLGPQSCLTKKLILHRSFLGHHKDWMRRS